MRIMALGVNVRVPMLNSGGGTWAFAHKDKDKDKKKKKAAVKLVGNGGFGGKKKKDEIWGCVEGCGACCKLVKGPSFATPEDIFTNPSDIQLYRSLIGTDGWCIHYEKTTRKCSIYPERPYFCRVEANVFESLHGISKKHFNKEACSSCRDTIKSIYGPHSKELDTFNNSASTA